MTIETYMGVMWFAVAACSLIGIIGIVYSKKTGGRKPLAQRREIEYKKSPYIYMYMTYIAIMTMNVFAFLTLPEEINIPLVVVLSVADVCMIAVYLAFMHKKTKKIVLYDDAFEIQSAFPGRVRRYKYSDVSSAGQNDSGDITIVVNGKTIELRKMNDAKDFLTLINSRMHS